MERTFPERFESHSTSVDAILPSGLAAMCFKISPMNESIIVDLGLRDEEVSNNFEGMCGMLCSQGAIMKAFSESCYRIVLVESTEVTSMQAFSEGQCILFLS
jgi:hypothetical protein